jgi:DNA-binding transcriptional MocR family regulator
MTQLSTQLAVATLMGNPALSQQDIAKTLNISRSTVARAIAKIKAEAKPELELMEYRGLIRKQVPAKIRVEAIEKIVKKADSNPFAALRAVEYADQVLGLAPKQQQSDPGCGPQPPALFTLPANTRVSMLISSGPDRRQTGGDQHAITISAEESTDA